MVLILFLGSTSNWFKSTYSKKLKQWFDTMGSVKVKKNYQAIINLVIQTNSNNFLYLIVSYLYARSYCALFFFG